MQSTSGDWKVEELLLKAITEMPTWKPAEDLNDVKVRKEFEFSVGGRDGC